MYIRDVTTGATGVTEVAPKSSDTLTISQPRGALQRLQLTFFCGYVPECVMIIVKDIGSILRKL